MKRVGSDESSESGHSHNPTTEKISVKKVMLGWELGGNSGHAIRLLTLGSVLNAEGFEVVYAVQQPDAFTHKSHAPVMQAPLWPRLLRTVPVPSHRHLPTSFADILARIGLGEPAMFSTMILSWDQLLKLTKPNLIFADFAPALCAAANGRIPVISIGTPYCQPPSTMLEFPNFFSAKKGVSQDHLLSLVNGELARAARTSVSRLPELFKVDSAVVAGFQELDPYRSWRTSSYHAPSAFMVDELTAESNEEIFVYFYRADGLASKLWDALQFSRLPARIFILRATSAEREQLRRRGFEVETDPVSWESIAAKSRMVISHGGMGFVSSALLAALPQIILHHDVEKMLNGRGVAVIGAGIERSLVHAKTDDLVVAITKMYHDEACAERAREIAPTFRGRMRNDPYRAALKEAAGLL